MSSRSEGNGNPCFECHCGFYDSDLGCSCPSSDMWYACPLSPEPNEEDFMNEAEYKAYFSKAVDLMKYEIECIKTADNGCDRQCEKCKLVKDSKELLKAYELAIRALQKVGGLTDEN